MSTCKEGTKAKQFAPISYRIESRFLPSTLINISDVVYFVVARLSPQSLHS
jgi:hypothetical protein